MALVRSDKVAVAKGFDSPDSTNYKEAANYKESAKLLSSQALFAANVYTITSGMMPDAACPLEFLATEGLCALVWVAFEKGGGTIGHPDFSGYLPGP